jgi:hypothetical protein
MEIATSVPIPEPDKTPVNVATQYNKRNTNEAFH